MTSRKRFWRRLLYLYLLLLVASHLVRWRQAETAPPPGERGESYGQSYGQEIVTVQAVRGKARLQETVRLAFLDVEPLAGAEAEAIPALLLHGSPGEKENFATVAPALARHRRVLALDLPGFGNSSRDVPDYSILAHAEYVRQFLDRLGVPRVHVVGFSMGGGVGIHLADEEPERVASLTLLSAIGVQEMELLGDYHLNHLLHGAQLGGLWLLRHAFPHFGLFDDAMIDVAYARNFYDTDQRPLRALLGRWQGPTLVLHSEDDVLVPVAAALEHHRLVPQSELELVHGNHFFVFTAGGETAARLEAFFERAESGEALTRAEASPERVARAAQAFDPTSIPAAAGLTLVVLMLVIACSTLVSEDLTCIGAGLMVAAGRIPFLPAVLACFVGIYVGDLMLYAAGRLLGRPALERAPLKWLLSAEDVERSSRWFARRGSVAILLSRFIPGTRLPTYFAAGLFRTHFWRFSFFFLLASALWTPLLVGLARWLGRRSLGYFAVFEQYAWLLVLGLALAILLGTRVFLPALTWRGRRLLRGSLRRKVRWEYWPPWVFYPPVVLWVLWLGLRYRRPTIFTAVNPAMPAGGFLGESKLEILGGLPASVGSGEDSARLARYGRIAADLPPEEALARLEELRGQLALDYPVVLKPDAGQRGQGVAVVRSAEDARGYFEHGHSRDVVVQEYVAGPELGLFYVRLPGEAAGRIFSVTRKLLPEVVGDGERTLEELILGEARLLAMAPYYLKVNHRHLETVPEAGETRRLVELGTHCRGAVFLDGRDLVTPELEAAVDALSRGYEGFFFGRYDVRGSSLDEIRAGRFRVLELNGVTSEATHIYDPANSLLCAYRVLFEQWRLAFEIGHRNARAGFEPVATGEFLRLLWRELRR